MAISNEQLGEFLKKNPISVSCVAVSLVLLGATYWHKGDAEMYEGQLKEKTAEADRLALNRKNAEQIKEHIDSILAAEKQIEARLIRPKDLTANTQYFYQLETDTGVKLLDPRTAGAPKKDPKASYQPVPFNVTVQGDYAQILNFLQHLENGRAFCRVLTATCTPSGQDRSGLLNLSLNLELLGTP